MMQTERNTYISISERTYTEWDVHPAMRRENRIVIHDGWQWVIGCIHNDEQLKEVLKFLEIEITTIHHEVEYKNTFGKCVFYNLSKDINNPCGGGFWNLKQLEEMSKGEKLKKFKGLSNGALVDCYVGIGKNIVNIYRPNPNAKEVYKPFKSISEEIQYRKNHWFL